MPSAHRVKTSTKIPTPQNSSRRVLAVSITGNARVGTDDQDLTSQIDALHMAGCAPIYTEHANGATMERPQWIECGRGLGKGGTTRSRSHRPLRTIHARPCKPLRRPWTMSIRLQSLSEGIDTTTTMGKRFFQLCATFAEYERSLIRERPASASTQPEPPADASADHPPSPPNNAAMHNDYINRGRGWPPSSGSSKSRPQQSDERSSSKR